MLVARDSLVKIEPDLPLDVVALVSCGVATGFGSAVHRAEVQPGDNVAVIGIGGVGINAVQGARMAGAKRVIAIDPVEFKREKAMEMGATHTYASHRGGAAGRARPHLGRDVRHASILTPGVVHRRHDRARRSTSPPRAARCVVTALAGRCSRHDVPLNLFMLSMMNKEREGHRVRLRQPPGRHPEPAVHVPRGRS